MTSKMTSPTTRRAGTWVMASDDELPDRFSDPRCDDFLYVCSNGWEGGISSGSAFMHKPTLWPQCFTSGPGSDATCTIVLLKRSEANQ